MRVLRILASLEFVLFRRKVFLAVMFGNELPKRIHRIFADPDAVCSDVGDKALCSFTGNVNAFVKLLDNLHGPGCRKAEFAACFLLKA